jgi:hypothetical protein
MRAGYKKPPAPLKDRIVKQGKMDFFVDEFYVSCAGSISQL